MTEAEDMAGEQNEQGRYASRVYRREAKLSVHPLIHMAVILLVLAVQSMSASSQTAKAAVTQTGRETGLPIPRFISLEATRGRMRVGPGTQYPILWLYTKPDIPLEVLAEYGNWLQVRDQTGATGWMHHALLSGYRTVAIAPWSNEPISLRKAPSPDSAIVARLEPSVIMGLEGCDGRWCHVFLDRQDPSVDGFLRQPNLWGVYPGEVVE